MTRHEITLDRVAWIVAADACIAEANRLSRLPNEKQGPWCLAIVPLREVDAAVRPVFLREPSRKELSRWFRREVVELVVRVLKDAGRGQTAARIAGQLPKQTKRRAA